MNELISTIEFQMSLLLFVALAGYLLAIKINQSAVIGEILLGIIIGPSLLGLITYTEFVESIAHLGAVILLFVIGLEFKLADLGKKRYFLIALSGVIIPWLSGYYVTKLFGFSSGGAIFVGTALTATSIAITANVLKEMGKLQTEAAKAIIGAAIIDDVLSLVALAVSGQVVSGTFSLSSAAIVLFKAAAFILVGIIAGHYFVSRAIIKVDRTNVAKKYPEFVFLFAMMTAFLYGMFAELIGLSAIVGSFIAGVSLEGIGLKHSKHFKDGADYLHIIFASIFFVSLGILVDMQALTVDIFGFLIILTIIALLSKIIGCSIPARLSGMSFKDSLTVGLGMAPRGEVAMIVALLALNQNLISQNIFTSLVLMSLLTTIATPLAFKNWLFKEDKIDFMPRKYLEKQKKNIGDFLVSLIKFE